MSIYMTAARSNYARDPVRPLRVLLFVGPALKGIPGGVLYWFSLRRGRETDMRLHCHELRAPYIRTFSSSSCVVIHGMSSC